MGGKPRKAPVAPEDAARWEFENQNAPTCHCFSPDPMEYIGCERVGPYLRKAYQCKRCGNTASRQEKR